MGQEAGDLSRSIFQLMLTVVPLAGSLFKTPVEHVVELVVAGLPATQSFFVSKVHPMLKCVVELMHTRLALQIHLKPMMKVE